MVYKSDEAGKKFKDAAQLILRHLKKICIDS
jgi:hypothetical protein